MRARDAYKREIVFLAPEMAASRREFIGSEAPPPIVRTHA
jgi:hypothetical protein